MYPGINLTPSRITYTKHGDSRLVNFGHTTRGYITEHLHENLESHTQHSRSSYKTQEYSLLTFFPGYYFVARARVCVLRPTALLLHKSAVHAENWLVTSRPPQLLIKLAAKRYL